MTPRGPGALTAEKKAFVIKQGSYEPRSLRAPWPLAGGLILQNRAGDCTASQRFWKVDSNILSNTPAQLLAKSGCSGGMQTVPWSHGPVGWDPEPGKPEGGGITATDKGLGVWTPAPPLAWCSRLPGRGCFHGRRGAGWGAGGFPGLREGGNSRPNNQFSEGEHAWVSATSALRALPSPAQAGSPCLIPPL